MTANERDKRMEESIRAHAVELFDLLQGIIPYAHFYLLDRVRGMPRDRELLTDGLPADWEPAHPYRMAEELIQKIVREK